MNATEKKQILAKIVEQQKKLREFAEANEIDERIVNMGASMDIDEMFQIMYPSYDSEEEETWECEECGKEIVEKEISRHFVEGGCVCNDCDEEDYGECPKCDCLVKRKDLAQRYGYHLDICAECDKENQ